MNTLISVIVPIYKVEKFINQCVDSIISQTYRSIEIILVDDGSPDNCPAICDRYAAEDSRIKVVHQKNKGLIEARKAGLRVATGDYICFVDGDDWIEPDMYECIVKAIDAYQPDCVVTQFYYSFPDCEDKSDYCFSKPYYDRKSLENEIFPVMLFNKEYYRFGVYPNCWTKVFRKSLLEKYLYCVPSEIRMGEDIAFTYPCLMECQSLAYIDKPLYHYRQNPASMTSSYDAKMKSIYSIPYEAIKNASRRLNVDLSEQLPYYLLFLTNFVIRNEALNKHKVAKKEISKIVELLIQYFNASENIRRIRPSILPLHTKCVYYLLVNKKALLIKCYIKLLKIVL